MRTGHLHSYAGGKPTVSERAMTRRRNGVTAATQRPGPAATRPAGAPCRGACHLQRSARFDGAADARMHNALRARPLRTDDVLVRIMPITAGRDCHMVMTRVRANGLDFEVDVRGRKEN